VANLLPVRVGSQAAVFTKDLIPSEETPDRYFFLDVYKRYEKNREYRFRPFEKEEKS